MEVGKGKKKEEKKYSRRLKQMNNKKVSLVRIKIQKMWEGDWGHFLPVSDNY